MKLSKAWEADSPEVGGVSWTEKNLSISLADNNILGILVEGKVMAFVVLREMDHAIEVDYLATDRRKLRKGYMSIVFSYLQDFSKKVTKPIWLEVSMNNTKAIKLYEKFGFIKGGARKNYYKKGQTAFNYTYNP